MDSKTAKKIKSKNTSIEKILAKELWSRCLRYRKNDKSVFGKPDFVFKSKKVAVFCDSEFWHGYNYLFKNEKFKTNIDFWENKIQKNIERDKEVNEFLTSNGWKVVRLWGNEIKKDLDRCIEKIISALKE